MTSKHRPSRSGPERSDGDHWPLQDAKAQFSEVVRRARSKGPQHVTVHGRDGVVIVSEELFRRLEKRQTGRALVEALAASPFPEVELEPTRARFPVRDVGL